MSTLSELYEQTFELNTLLSKINAIIHNTTDKYKLKILFKQRTVWLNKMNSLKKQIKEYTK